MELDFRFYNTCNSAYQESTMINDNTVYIALKDTASAHARCRCLQRNMLWYNIKNTEIIRIILDIKFYAHDDYTPCVDTLLALY